MTISDTQEAVRSYFSLWIPCLGLAWWEIEIEFYDDPVEVVKHFAVEDSPTEVVAARTFADWRYGTATIMVNLIALDGLSSSKQETVVVHELTHILVNEMQWQGKEHEERTVTNLTKAFKWVRDQFSSQEIDNSG